MSSTEQTKASSLDRPRPRLLVNRTLNALFGVAYDREDLESRPSVGQLWATYLKRRRAVGNRRDTPISKMFGALRELVRLAELASQSGLLQGIHFGSDLNAAAFGVPYAAPPMGELRWKPPRRAPRWTGTRKAINFGSSCPQLPAPWWSRSQQDRRGANPDVFATRKRGAHRMRFSMTANCPE
jgi:hypothetical protein